MNFDYLKKNRHVVRPVLLGIAAVLAVLAAAKLRDYYTASAETRSIVRKAVDQDKADPNLVKESLTGFKKIADALKKENLFLPRAIKRNPVSAVLGIMGDEALINGKWYKAGAKIGDAEVVAVEPTVVKIKWDGKEMSFAPISAITVAVSKPVDRVGKNPKVKDKGKYKEPAAKPKKIEAAKVASGKDDPLAWMGMELPPHLRKKILKLWSNASEEDKQRGMAEWNSASDEKKQEMLSQLEAMPDGAMDG